MHQPHQAFILGLEIVMSLNCRSLQTNLVLILLFALAFVLYFLVFESRGKVVLLSIFKGLAPALTALANFEKIRALLMVYCRICVNKLKPNC